MKGNLLELFDAQVKQELSDALIKVRPTSGKTLTDNLTIFHASIVARLIEITQQENGSESIRDFLISENLNGRTLDRIVDILNNSEQSTQIQNSGKKLLDFLFDEESGQLLPQIVEIISEKLQISQDEVLSIFHTITPFSMDLVGQIVHLDQLKDEQLSELLASNEEPILDRYPDLIAALGLQDKYTQIIPDTTSVPPHSDSESLEPTPPATASESETTSAPDKSEIEVQHQNQGKKRRTGLDLPTTEQVPEDKERFLKALWPWIALLILSAGALFFMNKFQFITSDESIESPIPTIGPDSVIQDEILDISLPGNIHLTVENGSFIDSLTEHLERNPQLSDTLRYWNSNINFKNSSAVLTTKASDELNGIVSILQTYPEIKMGIRLLYDSTFLTQESGIVNERVRNLSNYFRAFGLDQSRYEITNSINGPRDLTDPDTIGDSTTHLAPATPASVKPMVELLFYQDQLQPADSLKIQ